MFEKLKIALTSLASAITERTLSKGELEKRLQEFRIALFESDVAEPVAESLVNRIEERYVGMTVSRREDLQELLRRGLLEAVREVLTPHQTLDLERAISSKERPFVILFLGINGTGKTTTIAKMAHMLSSKGYSVVMAASDTHRAGAIEQLKEHADRLGIKVVAQQYGADPAAVARDAVVHAQKNGIDVVLIDTAGRMQTSKNLMEQMAKIVRVVRPHLKLFIGDALAGNDVVFQAKEFLAYTDFDAAILTKADADAKGGAIISIAYVTGRPIIYLGIGQGYNDLVPFDPDRFLKDFLAK